jgi:hypothetical protein
MRGRQGNASQTIFAIPFALDGERGETIIQSPGITAWVTGCGAGLLPGCDQSFRLKTCSERRSKWQTPPL